MEIDNKYKSTEKILLPRAFNEKWVDLIRDLVTEIGEDTPRSVKKIIGDHVRKTLKEDGIIEKDCVIAFARTIDSDELVVVLFEGTDETDIVNEGILEQVGDDGYIMKKREEKQDDR